MKRPEVHYQSRHETGNIFAILALVRNVLRKERRINEFNELHDRVLKSGSYENALNIINEKVRLIDDDNPF